MSKTYDELKRAELFRNCPNVVPHGLHVKADISTNGDLLVAGTIEGLIQMEDGTLTIEETGKVFADIEAREVIVCGEVQGNIAATDRIEIRNPAIVIGNLSSARIVIDEGASFKGSMEIIGRRNSNSIIPMALQPDRHTQALTALGSH